MDKNHALDAFAALSQDTRLDVFRHLIMAGDTGLLSGEIGEQLGVKQNTMSTNLAILLRAGLVRNERQGRAIRYFADMQGISALLTYLLQDCCGGAADQCLPLVESLCHCTSDPNVPTSSQGC